MASLEIVTLDGGRAALDAQAVDELRARLKGQLLTPADDDYERARQVWNGMIDRHPALIARCAGTDDVAAAVRFAREHQILLAVRGGSHNVAGLASCDGGLVIDLSQMKDVQVDPEARLAKVGGGATWGEVDAATQPFGLAVPGGVVSETGVAGLTLGGGLGWVRRKYGLSCDNLLAAEVVTADGQMLRASETEHPDLLWGLRGGGGNFGVVTTFEFRLQPVGPEVMVVATLYPAERAKELVSFFRSYSETAPDEVSGFAIWASVPAAPFIPAELHGQPTVILAACYAGPADEGEAILQPLREQGDAQFDLSGRMPYVELQKFFDEDYPAGELQYYWKSVFLRELSDEALDRLIELAAERPSPLSTIDLWQMGGAISRVRPDETAFPERESPYLVGIESNWADPADNQRNIAWTRRVFEEMQPFSTGRPYLNFEEIREGVAQAALRGNYDRLVAIKRRYDPTNLFRVNQNIKGGASEPAGAV
jgi:FAD/FMN-containing dehydrogenase